MLARALQPAWTMRPKYQKTGWSVSSSSPIPLPTSPLKGEEPIISRPFKGRAMGDGARSAVGGANRLPHYQNIQSANVHLSGHFRALTPQDPELSAENCGRAIHVARIRGSRLSLQHAAIKGFILSLDFKPMSGRLIAPSGCLARRPTRGQIIGVSINNLRGVSEEGAS